MRRILLSCATLAALTLLSASSAGARGQARPGLLVVRNAQGDRSIFGHPAVTVAVVKGFVLGRISPRAEARVDVFQLPTTAGEGGPQVHPDVRTKTVWWHHVKGKEYRGNGFRFSAIGGSYRVVVWGSGIYLFAGGQGTATLQGSSVYRRSDGSYSIDGGPFLSLPARALTHDIGRS
jgi:hypothetical protein